MESDGGREPIWSSAAEEEALKRKNTDCVYFLASPLTCKKGSECDYRHSEGARVNPRDCWYWLNGDCLNPKCSFRHPGRKMLRGSGLQPLDFMFATPMANSGPTPPPSQTPASALAQAARAPNNSSKQSVPCYYFQWGQCLKGERCPFMHEPQPSINFVSQQSAKSSTFSAESRQTNEKNAQNITKQQNVAEISFDNPKEFINKHVGISPTTAKFVTKAENASKLELSENKTLQRLSDNDPPALPQNDIVNDSYLQSQSWGQQVQHPDDKTYNRKDTDELLLEHSPGFDVLVDDDIEDPDYHHSEDNFRRGSTHGCQNMEAEDEYEYHQSDYETRAEIETDLHNDIGQYDNYEQLYSRYDGESKTSHRILERSPSLERRVLDRERKPNAMDGSDLRYQLMKRRRINDSRSTSNHGGHSEHYRKDEQYAERHYGRHARNNTKFTSEKSISSRLQGRIAFPGKTTSEQERGRRPESRLSPVTRINYQSRDSERTRLLPSKEFSKDEKTHRNRINPRDGTKSLDFASPKSLSVLKGIKINKNIHDLSTTSSNLTLNNVKSKKVEGVHESENPPSFEGPLPLGAILKRKRESTYAENKLSTGQHENNQADGGPAINESVRQLEARNGGSFTIGSPEEGVIPTEDDLTSDVESATKADAMETEDGMTLENDEVEELENYDRQDGDFDYESGEYKVDDENTIHSDEADLDDDDDFARKISVMLS